MTFVPPPVRADLAVRPRIRLVRHERDTIHVPFINWLDLVGYAQYPELALGFAIPNQRGKDKLAAILRWKEGARSGPADWCLPLPHGRYVMGLDPCRRFSGLFLEFKATGGTTQKTQRAWLAGVAEAGYQVVQPTTTQQAIDAVLQYLALPARYDVARVRAHGEALLLERAKLRLKRRKAK